MAIEHFASEACRSQDTITCPTAPRQPSRTRHDTIELAGSAGILHRVISPRASSFHGRSEAPSGIGSSRSGDGEKAGGRKP